MVIGTALGEEGGKQSPWSIVLSLTEHSKPFLLWPELVWTRGGEALPSLGGVDPALSGSATAPAPGLLQVRAVLQQHIAC